jgi:hypothetical protein
VAPIAEARSPERREREAKTKVTQSILIELAKTPLNARL